MFFVSVFLIFFMLYYIKLYLRDWWINISLVLGILLQLLIWAYLIMNIDSDLDRVFLHYNIIFGVDLVGEWWKIYYLPITGLVILLINNIVSYLIYKTDKFLSRLLNFWVVFIHVFLLIAVWLLVRLNV